jgi:hypothetical protein
MENAEGDSTGVVARPRIGKLQDRRFGSVDFLSERNGRSGASLRVPARGDLRFLESFLEILNLASHVRLLRGCGGVFRPRNRFGDPRVDAFEACSNFRRPRGFRVCVNFGIETLD